MPPGRAVHHLACTVQPGGGVIQKWGKYLHKLHMVGQWNTVQAIMLHLNLGEQRRNISLHKNKINKLRHKQPMFVIVLHFNHLICLCNVRLVRL